MSRFAFVNAVKQKSILSTTIRAFLSSKKETYPHKSPILFMREHLAGTSVIR